MWLYKAVAGKPSIVREWKSFGSTESERKLTSPICQQWFHQHTCPSILSNVYVKFEEARVIISKVKAAYCEDTIIFISLLETWKDTTLDTTLFAYILKFWHDAKYGIDTPATFATFGSFG